MKEAKIIILAGQSNAVGVGHVEYLPHHFEYDKIVEFETGYSNVMINYYSHNKKSGGFIKTSLNCSENDADTFGPEIGIAETIDGKYPGKQAFIIKCAFGSTNMIRDWLSPSNGGEYNCDAYADQKDDIIKAIENGEEVRAGWCYNELIKIVKESIDILKNDGYFPKIYSFCWMQGESDAFNMDDVDGYSMRYDNMLKDFRSEFPDYIKDDCIYVDCGISEMWKCYREMNEVKSKYASEHENCCFVDTVAAGLTTLNEPIGNPDWAHYDSDCVVKLGRLLAEKILFVE